MSSEQQRTPTPIDRIAEDWNCRDGGCTVLLLPGGKEAVLLNDSCYAAAEPPKDPKAAGRAHIAFVPTACGATNRYLLTAKGWADVDTLDDPQLAGAEGNAARKGFAEGKVEVRTVPRRQVFVGGVPVGDPFE